MRSCSITAQKGHFFMASAKSLSVADRKHRLAERLTHLMKGDIDVVFEPTYVVVGSPSEQEASSGHLFKAEHVVDYDNPYVTSLLFWMDDREGPVQEQLVTKLRERAAWLNKMARIVAAKAK